MRFEVPVAGSMHTNKPEPSQRLAAAFSSWCGARAQLGNLRAHVTAGGRATGFGEPASLATALRNQEAECARLWRELARVEAEMAAARDAGLHAAIEAPVHALGVDAGSGAGAPAHEAVVNVLVVDDEASNLAALEPILDAPGCRLVRAASGEEALLKLMTEDFACLVLAAQMAGMSGFELARLAKELRRAARTPIIFLTGSSKDEEHAREGYASGAVDCLHEPIDPAVLRQKVGVFVELDGMHRRLQRRAAEREQVARSEASRRAEFLSRLSRELSCSRHLDDTIAAVLALCVPALGEQAVLGLADQDGRLRSQELLPAPPVGQTPEVPPDLRAEAEAAMRSGEVRRFRRGGRTAVTWPLVCADEVRGALTIVGTAQRVGDGSCELARELASRAAIVLENARLSTELHEACRRENRFLAMLAHELRNPLAPISNAVQIIQNQALPPSSNWACEVIARQAGQMARLIDELLDLSRLVQGKLSLKREVFTLASLVDAAMETAAPQASARDQALEAELPAEAIEIEGDPVRLAQALSNLLDNASKFSGPRTAIRVAAEWADGEVRIAVKDAGTGIAPEFLPHVFDLFAQGEQPLDRPDGGLGIGLTLVKHILELHGGRVAAHSAGIGNGTEVVVRLPAQKAAGRQAGIGAVAPIATRPAVQGGPPVRVLVVDDHVTSAETLAALLEMNGFEVRAAHDGVAALDAARAFRPAVVLLDIGLPGLSGFEVAQRLREQPQSRDALLIALTGYGEPETRSRSAQAGFDFHMTKPADLQLLLSLLVDPLATRRGSACRPQAADSAAAGGAGE